MIAELQEERQRLDEAIEALERLSTGNHLRRRGRPPRSRRELDEVANGGLSSNGDGDHLPPQMNARAKKAG